MKALKPLLFIILLSTLLFSKENFKVQTVLTSLGVIWGMDFLSKDELILTIRSGEAYTYNLKTKSLVKIKNLPKVYAKSQGGLLDIKVSPNYKEDGFIYITYVKEDKKHGHTVLARTKLKDNAFENFEDIFISNASSTSKVHYGSRITFDKNGNLYFGIGDRGKRDFAQDMNLHAGKIIRVNLNTLEAKIYSSGHRNPQGLFYDKRREILFEGEHGPRGGDEVNIIKENQNYGWPIISYGKEYWNFASIGEGTSKKGMINPIKYYIPSIAPSSLMVYSGKVFKSWQGDIFQGSLKLTHLNKLKLNDKNEVIEEKRLLEDLYERIRNVIESPEGLIYISTDSGKILRISP